MALLILTLSLCAILFVIAIGLIVLELTKPKEPTYYEWLEENNKRQWLKKDKK